MLEDRDYMRQPSFERSYPFTIGILIVNVVAYIIQIIGSHQINGQAIEDSYFRLSLDGLKGGHIWELLTFQFMHVSIIHLLGNSLAIYFFGRAVESALGAKRFLFIYFASGIMGGALQMLFTLIFHQGDYVVGASAGAAGLIGAFCMLAWDEEFEAILYFWPVRLRGKTLLAISLAMSVVLMVMPESLAKAINMYGLANAAHLGGILTGFFYVRQIVQGRWHLPQWRLPQRHIAPPRELVVKRAGKSWSSKPIPSAEDLSAEEYLQKEVDPILDKISARGIQSLTQREREILERARSKMNKR